MGQQRDSRPQGWRAMAVFSDRSERLLYLGRSSAQILAGFAQAFFEVFDDEEREQVRSISLQRWHGAPEAGRWLHQENLEIPLAVRVMPSE